VGQGAPEHRAALRTALERGVNLLDTAPSFALGDSERLFGECLSSLVDEGRLQRDEVVVVTKLGLAQGADRARIEARMRNHTPYEGIVWLDDEQSLAYGVGEEFLRDQLSGSLERLGLEHVDVCLLQNPEHLLTAATGDATAFLMERLTSAFRHLENEVTRGRIGCYGVSTNSAGAQADPSQAPPISVELLLRAAVAAGGTTHHFRVLELPLNLAETGALRQSGGVAPAIEQAVRNGLAVLANRPLNAFVDGAVVRLAEPPKLPGEAELPELGAARRRVAALEAELEQKLAPVLRAVGVLGKEPVFAFGGAWGQAVERAASVQQFEHLEATVLMPSVRQRLTELDGAFSGPQGEQWRVFRARYVEALGIWLAAARSAAGEGNRRLFERVSGQLKSRAELADALAGPLGQAPWAQRSIAVVRSVEGVTSVLVGMRSTSHVDAALASLSLDVPELQTL
jgi:aryl-alcohol dehydrogenase-like predicted oxidoreductase